ncbi:hypothetical protein QYE76_039604 [Lolium multiflorum]|uniref:Uncharacterized protein n=1 Tax=Lolium multiflorum TaxID=4521 RepID=A0AAD8TA67_LOLMU|nr:hypothetical protein QYE76_039604 [Lolium multiflorum]
MLTAPIFGPRRRARPSALRPIPVVCVQNGGRTRQTLGRAWDSTALAVGKQLVNIPSFMVRVDTEKHVDFSLTSPLGGGPAGRVKRKNQKKASGGGGGDREEEE